MSGRYRGSSSGVLAISRCSSLDEIRTARPPNWALRMMPSLIRRRIDFSLILSAVATSATVNRTGAGRGSGASVQTKANGEWARANGCDNGRLLSASIRGDLRSPIPESDTGQLQAQRASSMLEMPGESRPVGDSDLAPIDMMRQDKMPMRAHFR
jgi:hypothetical protein